MVIRKLPEKHEWRLYSRKGKNLGTFPTKAAAYKHEGQVEWFKKHSKRR